MMFDRRIAAAAMAMFATPALAHTGHGDVSTFRDGLLHPLFGLDHVLAMLAVGLWAGMVGGRALMAWPASFVIAMLAGGIVGVALPGLPMVEPAIALSVVTLGTVVAFGWRLPTVVGAAVCAAFGIVHGYAHGAEMPGGQPFVLYGAGFALATAALHGVGITLALTGQRHAGPLATRVAGALTTVAGMWLAVA
jgi:urease accessory protein